LCHTERKTKGEERGHQRCVGGGVVQIQGQEKELFFLILKLPVVIIYDNNVSLLLEDAKISF
jgi:hypothetical protein